MTTTTAPTSASTPTRFVDVDRTRFAHPELGEPRGVPLVFLHHFTATIDDWDPRSGRQTTTRGGPEAKGPLQHPAEPRTRDGNGRTGEQR